MAFKFDFDKTFIGLIVGSIAPVIAMLAYFKISYGYMTLGEFLRFLKMGGNYPVFISICILINLAAFYPFIWKEKYKGAKGVLAATFLWASVVIYLKFF
jgi:1,4-dihydroxy-2-naphthoate octaprenyltransferase